MHYLIILLLLLLPFITFGQHGNHALDTKEAVLEKGFGEVHLPISTKSAEAQKFFNLGLAHIYGFNHDEAVRSFKRAAEIDPQMAMAYWGVALAHGTNYNLKADTNALKAAFENLQKAQSLAGKVTVHEQAYIAALAKRYSVDPNADQNKLAVDYKNAMRELVKQYPDDLDAATLYAESMMNLRPWQLWTADGKPAEGTLEIVAVLENVLRRNPNHIGANHYYIHAVEASPNPERALPSAARLGKLAPKAGHLVHMPYHIYARTGNYEEAALSNIDAVIADREYLAKSGAQGVYPMMYYNHNIHCLASAYLMTGNYAGAIKTARELEDNVKKHVEMTPMLEMFMPYQMITMVRFNKWDEVMSYPQPDAKLKITTAIWHFSRGMSHAAKSDVQKAETELKAFQAIAKTVPAEMPWGNSTAAGMLRVAENMLAGKIALARGEKQAAVAFLTKAVEAEDALNYAEPPDWDIPTRELLGGAHLLNGEYAASETVFRAELEKHPRNGRALFGLHESLQRQGKQTAAALVKSQFETAWAKSDTKLAVAELVGMNALKTTSELLPK
jgi:tetratricopeptide (TPR) repeat protein